MLTYDQIIFRCSLKETSFWLPGGPPPKPGPLGRQKPTKWQLSGRWNLTVQQRLDRQSLIPWPQAHSIQQSHSEGMQHLEAAALEEEGRGCLSFLSACWAALQTCPPDALEVLMYPLHLLTGNMPLGTSLVSSPLGIYYQGGTYSYICPDGTHTLPRG